MNPPLNSLLEAIEAKLWLLAIAEMELRLAEELLAAFDELAKVAEVCRHSPSVLAARRGARLEATVARLDAELEALERALASTTAGKAARPSRSSSSATQGERGRGRPRKHASEDAVSPGEPTHATNEEGK